MNGQCLRNRMFTGLFTASMSWLQHVEHCIDRLAKRSRKQHRRGFGQARPRLSAYQDLLQ